MQKQRRNSGNGLGSKQIIAGHTSARKLYMFFNMPFTAMGQAASTFVSQNRGAGNPSRIRKGMKEMYIYDVVVAAIVTVILLFSAPTLVKWISGTSDHTVLYNGSLYLRIVAPNYAVLGVLMQTRFALQGIVSEKNTANFTIKARNVILPSIGTV